MLHKLQINYVHIQNNKVNHSKIYITQTTLYNMKNNVLVGFLPTCLKCHFLGKNISLTQVFNIRKLMRQQYHLSALIYNTSHLCIKVSCSVVTFVLSLCIFIIYLDLKW